MRSVTRVLSPSAAKTTTGTQSAWISLHEAALAADFYLNISAISGTSPTIIIAIQKGYYAPAAGDTIGQETSGSLTWADGWSFTQVTTATGIRTMFVGTSATIFEGAITQNAILTNVQHAGPLGDLFRVAWQIGGTNPSYTFSLTGKFYF